MASVKQFQRRAIERLLPYADPLPVSCNTKRFCLCSGGRLYKLGASQGVGTCSDVLDVDVLVVGRRQVCGSGAYVRSRSFAAIVLIRPATRKERKLARAGVDQTIMTVELLIVKRQTKSTVYFSRSGKRSYYVKLA
ncbi:MAG: hypothetical protein ACPGO5_04810 [Patescibacteria group bacterium]